VTGVFGGITILTMMGIVLVSMKGFNLIPLKGLERYTHALAGERSACAGSPFNFSLFEAENHQAVILIWIKGLGYISLTLFLDTEAGYISLACEWGNKYCT